MKSNRRMRQILETHLYTDTLTKTPLPYRLLQPAVKDSHRHYPLVLFLHGAGERGTDNQAQIQIGKGAAEFIATANHHAYFFLAPQCPPALSWSGVPWDSLPYRMPTEPTEPMRILLHLITAVCQTHRIDRNRIYATGLSMGALGVWDMVMRAPTVFAAGVAICGGYDATQVERIRDVPFWVFHGTDDPSVPVHGSRAIVRALQGIGGSVRYTEYQGAGHAIWEQTYRNSELINWLFHQSRLNRRDGTGDTM